jgi:hypothetical protein
MASTQLVEGRVSTPPSPGRIAALTQSSGVRGMAPPPSGRHGEDEGGLPSGSRRCGVLATAGANGLLLEAEGVAGRRDAVGGGADADN